MLRFLIILLLPFVLNAQDWVLFRSGPFEVYSAAGNRPGREALNELEQLRNGLRQTLGAEELHSVWPIRLVVFDSPRQARNYPLGSFRLARDSWVGAIVKDRPVPYRDLVRILLDANTNRMGEEVERGLVGVFSTLDVEGTIVTLGAPIPADQRDAGWARVHMLTVTPEYGGKARVFFSVLEKVADDFAAHKNAFSKTPQEIAAEVEAYFAAGQFGVRRLSGAPIDPRRDFRARQVDPLLMRVILADLLEGDAARAAYTAILNDAPESPEALEGTGRLGEAIAAGSESARCYLRAGLAEKDKTKSAAAFQKALELNPRWAEPNVRLAEIDSNPAMKIRRLVKATELDPRNVAYWRMLAETYLATNAFPEASRAWAGAERAAADEAERERILQARIDVQAQRADFLAEKRRQEREAREKELARLREEMMTRIRAAEEEVNADDPDQPSDRKVVDWWDDPRPKEKVSGTLERVDCRRGSAALTLKTYDGGEIRLAITDPGQIAILGGGEKALGCGPQKPPPNVTVEYFIQDNPKGKTSGEVVAVDFR